MTWQRTLTVTFTGSHGGTEPLSWGQQSIWHTLRWLDDDDPYFNVPWVFPVPGGHTAEEAAAAFGRLVERHEILRTTFTESPEGTRQHIAREGKLELPVHRADEETDGADGTGPDPVYDAQARALAEDLARKAFDHAREPGVRCALLTGPDGAPVRLALVFSHATVDAWSLRTLEQDWRALLSGDGPGTPAPQPRERARFESGGPGAVRGEQSLEYWRTSLPKVPLSLFGPARHEPQSPRFVKVALRSTALAVAATTLSARWSVSTASVLTVACGTVLGLQTGHRTLGMQLIVANRHDARFRDMAGPAAQDGLLVLELDPRATLAETVQRGHMQAMAAYRFGHYDPAAVRALREETARERGGELDLSAYFNDVRPTGRWTDLPEDLTSEELTGLAARSTTEVLGAWDKVDAKAFFATGFSTTQGELTLLADTAHLPQDDAVALLRAVETLLIAGVTQGDVPVRDLAGVCGLPLHTDH